MPKTLRRLSYARGISNLITSTIFGVSFLSIALSLFFFSPGRMMSIRISVLSAACIALLLSSGALSKRRKRVVKMPLLLLAFAGLVFACWGGVVIAKALLLHASDISVVINGAQFVLFGVVTLLTSLFARR